MRLLQQTLRTAQCENWSGKVDMASALTERDGQIKALCGHMERLALEKESLQQELKSLKIKVGEINDQLGMLMETIQAKDEVIMKLSQQSQEGSTEAIDCSSPLARERQELQHLRVSRPDNVIRIRLQYDQHCWMLQLNLVWNC